MNTKNIKFQYLKSDYFGFEEIKVNNKLYYRQIKRDVMLTIASKLTKDEYKNLYVLEFSWTFKNKNDKYNKKIAKEFSIQRLIEKDKSFYKKLEILNPSYYGIRNLMLSEIEKTNYNKKDYCWLLDDYRYDNLDEEKKTILYDLFLEQMSDSFTKSMSNDIYKSNHNFGIIDALSNKSESTFKKFKNWFHRL